MVQGHLGQGRWSFFGRNIPDPHRNLSIDLIHPKAFARSTNLLCYRTSVSRQQPPTPRLHLYTFIILSWYSLVLFLGSSVIDIITTPHALAVSCQFEISCWQLARRASSTHIHIDRYTYANAIRGSFCPDKPICSVALGGGGSLCRRRYVDLIQEGRSPASWEKGEEASGLQAEPSGCYPTLDMWTRRLRKIKSSS